MLTFRDYLAFAEQYALDAQAKGAQPSQKERLLIPATILAWSAIECFVNDRLDDFGALPQGTFQLHETAFLHERKIRFVDSGHNMGQFVLEGPEYRKLEDKILFLLAKSGATGSAKPKGQRLWQDFEKLKDARDALVHPRQGKEITLTVAQVQGFLETAKTVIQFVSNKLWNKTLRL